MDSLSIAVSPALGREEFPVAVAAGPLPTGVGNSFAAELNRCRELPPPSLVTVPSGSAGEADVSASQIQGFTDRHPAEKSDDSAPAEVTRDHASRRSKAKPPIQANDGAAAGGASEETAHVNRISCSPLSCPAAPPKTEGQTQSSILSPGDVVSVFPGGQPKAATSGLCDPDAKPVPSVMGLPAASQAGAAASSSKKKPSVPEQSESSQEVETNSDRNVPCEASPTSSEASSGLKKIFPTNLTNSAASAVGGQSPAAALSLRQQASATDLHPELAAPPEFGVSVLPQISSLSPRPETSLRASEGAATTIPVIEPAAGIPVRPSDVGREAETPTALPTPKLEAKSAILGGAATQEEARPRELPREQGAIEAIPQPASAGALATAGIQSTILATERSPTASGGPTHAGPQPDSHGNPVPADASSPGADLRSREDNSSSWFHGAEAARLLERLDRSAMQVELRVEPFGPVALHTVVKQSEVGASIGVESRDARAILAAQVPSLEQALANRDLHLERIDIFSGGATGGSGGRPSSQQGASDHPLSVPRFSGDLSGDSVFLPPEEAQTEVDWMGRLSIRV